MPAGLEDILSLSDHLADEAGAIIRQHFRSDFAVENKSDKSPVTVADRAVEQRLRQIIEQQRPEDGIIGEEYGTKDGKNNLTWVFDPIDGTKSFVVGRPTFGTLIALCRDGVPILGIIDQPVSGERWTGAEGQPTRFNGQAVKTGDCRDLGTCRAASTSPAQLPGLWPRLYESCNIVTWGGDCYSYGLMACGWLDFIVETGLNIYDYAALPPIVEGAGGLMCDWDGRKLSVASGDKVIALGNPALKEEALAFVNAV